MDSMVEQIAKQMRDQIEAKEDIGGEYVYLTHRDADEVLRILKKEACPRRPQRVYLEITGRWECTNCYSVIHQGDSYCARCGTKIDWEA